MNEEVKGKHGSRFPKCEFTFKVDPSEINKIYFLHPTLHKYFEIPYAKLGGSSMSVWDYRRAYKMLKENGEEINQDSIFTMHRKLKSLEEAAKQKTNYTRKAAARKDQLNREEKLDVPKAKSDPIIHTTFKLEQTEIKPFEIDYGKKAFK